VRQALALAKEVDVLRGILPICTECRKISNGHERWDSVEQYLSDRSEAKVSPTICPDCARAHYAQTYDRR
jgi:two-component system cell cycle response regulator